jgi:hypothetical protein
MSELRDGLETVEQAIYESLGLVLPGAVALAGGACVLIPDALPAMLGFAAAHQWITLAICYLVGYPVQSLSRPIDKVTVLPVQLSVRFLGKLWPAAAAWLTSTWRRVGKWLQSGHRPQREDGSNSDSRSLASLSAIEHASWAARLGLRDDQRLDAFDVKNLSFSTLGADQRRLHRFRAITSLCRAMASMAAAAALLSVYLIARGRFSLSGVTIVLACIVVFLAFRERANMYDGLWNGIITPQYLANNARSAPAIAPAIGGIVSTTTPSPPVELSMESSVDPISRTIISDAKGSAPDPERRDLRQ